ncbi:murein hydrolase activator EnvC family protein [Romboutsia sp. 13368]|uniref:murein hydrolase activator EnvC family protein n=1 Tax=Romboutsia sp. 13368 TaxID=2708053 RepID=UPI0025E1432E|nr:M23 family metallopeptidase [Romboutsia sp. 13368]
MRKIITTIILCSIIFSTSFIYAENEQLDLQKKLTENRDSQLRLDEKIIELNSKIKEVEGKILSTNEEINKLDLQVNDIKSEINDLENNIENNKKQLSKRIKVINSNYSMSYIKILLNSSSISDFFNNMYIVKEIVKQDKEVLTELDENKEEIENKKSQIEKKKAEQEELKLLLKKDSESLNADKVEVENLKLQLEKEENELEADIEKIALQSVVNGESQVIFSGSWPVPSHSRISSPYGYRIHPIFNTKKMHTGIDIPAPTGTPTVSIDPGKVIFSGYKGGYGKTVMIQHDDGKVTLYAHNNELTVSVGQRVQKGQVVAKIGSTGNSTGPHLHFEVRINGKHVNPVPYIK